MNFDINKNKMFLVTLAAVLVVVVVTLVLWKGSVSKYEAACASFSEANESYEALCKTYKNAPGKTLEEAYQKDLADLKKQSADFMGAISTEPVPVLDPSSFKIELRKYDNEIKNEREKRNINIYQGEGFSEYLGDVVAKEDEMPALCAQFQTVKDVLSVLLDNDVLEVVTIERNPGQASESSYDEEEEDAYSTGSTAKKAADDKKFTATPVSFQFAIRPEKAYNVLAQLRNKPNFYIVRSIRTDLQPDPVGNIEDPSDILERMTVDMVVEIIQIAKPAIETK